MEEEFARKVSYVNLKAKEQDPKFYARNQKWNRLLARVVANTFSAKSKEKKQ